MTLNKGMARFDVSVNFKLTEVLRKELNNFSRKRGLTLPPLIRIALKHYMESQGIFYPDSYYFGQDEEDVGESPDNKNTPKDSEEKKK